MSKTQILQVTEDDIKQIAPIFSSCVLRLLSDNTPDMSTKEVREHAITHIRDIAIAYEKAAFSAKPKEVMQNVLEGARATKEGLNGKNDNDRGRAE